MFPNLYSSLWEVKQYVNNRILKDPWTHYYEASRADDRVPEKWLYDIHLPDYIDEILDLGCGAGRNFIPFDSRLKLWGKDIVPEDRIKWVKPFTNITYEHLNVEQLTRRLERTPRDMSKTFVFSSGTLMYVSKRYQRRFYESCKKNGCKNFLFHEYPSTSTKHSVENFKLPPQWFAVRKLRESAEDQVRGFFDMDTRLIPPNVRT